MWHSNNFWPAFMCVDRWGRPDCSAGTGVLGPIDRMAHTHPRKLTPLALIFRQFCKFSRVLNIQTIITRQTRTRRLHFYIYQTSIWIRLMFYGQIIRILQCKVEKISFFLLNMKIGVCNVDLSPQSSLALSSYTHIAPLCHRKGAHKQHWSNAKKWSVRLRLVWECAPSIIIIIEVSLSLKIPIKGQYIICC